jgi:hypothetical protein
VTAIDPAYLAGLAATEIEIYNDAPEVLTFGHLADDEGLAAIHAAIIAPVLDLHYEAYNDVEMSPVCPHCRGRAVELEFCGCWSPKDTDRTTFCASCVVRDHSGVRYSAQPWPCPTLQALGVTG